MVYLVGVGQNMLATFTTLQLGSSIWCYGNNGMPRFRLI